MGVSIKTSTNSPSPISSRAICRSALNGEMNETSTIRPASTISLATSATRRMFSTRSASVKPRSLLRPWRTLSPSRIGVAAFDCEALFQDVRDRRFAGAGKAGQPDNARLLTFRSRPCSLVDVHRLPVDVLTATQCEIQKTGAHGAAGDPIDQNEAAEIVIFNVGVEGDRRIEQEVADADLVKFEPSGGQVFERVDIDLVLGFGDLRGDHARTQFHQVRSARQQGFFVEPDDARLELIGDRRWA